MKKYKTVIEIVTEANNKNEALDMAGDFLSGNIPTGVEMKYASNVVHSTSVKVVAVTIFVCALVAGIFSVHAIIPTRYNGSFVPSMNAVQSPLKTSSSGMLSDEFKKEWERRHFDEALKHIPTTR